MPLNAMADVSRETQDKLEQYHALLLKWQKAINLISPGTVETAWHRHFEDSLQILSLISENTKTLYDLGSGAGFPGLVAAMCRPDLDVHLIESDERKGQFLRTVSRETKALITVHTDRIESLDIAPPDIVTARALADLKTLCGFCENWANANPNFAMIFMKGRNAEQEITDAQAHYDFDLETFPSETDKEAVILRLTNLRKKQG